MSEKYPTNALISVNPTSSLDLDFQLRAYFKSKSFIPKLEQSFSIERLFYHDTALTAAFFCLLP